MADFDYLQWHFSAALELADLYIAQNLIVTLDNPLTYGQTISIPDCSSNTYATQFKFYSAACGVWLKCSYKLPSPVEQHCDGGYDPPYPAYSKNGDNWVDVYKYQSCGTTCCKREYHICKVGHLSSSGINQYYTYVVTRLPSVAITECTDAQQVPYPYTHWEDGTTEIPCVNGCDQP